MSNRRKLIRPSTWKDKRAPQPGTVRTWLRAAEEEGLCERVGVARTGKPGRPAVLWGVTPEAAAADAQQMSSRELARERARVIRAGGRGVWLEALQAEIRRRRGGETS